MRIILWPTFLFVYRSYNCHKLYKSENIENLVMSLSQKKKKKKNIFVLIIRD